jgi:hypothetical protein
MGKFFQVLTSAEKFYSYLKGLTHEYLGLTYYRHFYCAGLSDRNARHREDMGKKSKKHF